MIDGVLLPAGKLQGAQALPAHHKNSYFPFFFLIQRNREAHD